MKLALYGLLCLSPLWSLEQGELKFAIGGKQYQTSQAQGMVQPKKGKSRIMIAVKDATAHFMLVLTADVDSGQEKLPLFLNTADSSLTATLKTRQGALAVMPQVQLARVDPRIEYVEVTHVETSETEDDPEDHATHGNNGHHRRKRRKMRAEFKRVKPRWHTMDKKERLKTGEGIIENKAFRDTYFTLQLVPVLSQGKVVSYTGSFSGTGRYSGSIAGAEVRSISNGVFNVKVENVP
jgi:hypothetical protein